MKQICVYKENEMFEKTLRENYSEEVSNILIEWIEEALSYVFKNSSTESLFNLGYVDRDTKEIEYSEDMLSVQDIIQLILREMDYALDGTENRELIEEEIKILSEAL